MIAEFIGIIATTFLVIGYSQKKESKLRFINNIGTILFIIYGFLIGALSVWLLNILILIINTNRIINMKRRK